MIGKETRAQCLEKWNGKPDIVMACVGGGSNAMGIFNEFVDDEGIRLIGVEVSYGASINHMAPCILIKMPFNRLINCFVLNISHTLGRW